jgi:hypothetical protein
MGNTGSLDDDSPKSDLQIVEKPGAMASKAEFLQGLFVNVKLREAPVDFVKPGSVI